MGGFRLVCASEKMKQVAAAVRMSGVRSLLITGETGVGKDALARWAHTISPNADGPFVALNCAAIQESLWESEIFGHARGAFTGAVGDKAGQVEGAGGGTLFLNEIGDMPLSTQAKLLTFLDTGEYQRVGETRTRTVETRVIAATNRDLEREIEEGRFRADLFYRLAGVQVWIAPLRERPADILALARLRLQRITRERDADPVGLAGPTSEMLIQERWKGNVRELHAAIETAFERCMQAGDSSLAPEHFAEAFRRPRPSGDEIVPSPEASKPDGAGAVHPDPKTASSVEGKRLLNIPDVTDASGDILGDPVALKSFLDSTTTSAGRWNITLAHSLLVDAGRIKIGRRAFAHRVRQIFPDAQAVPPTVWHSEGS